jgi:hypothetical protein
MTEPAEPKIPVTQAKQIRVLVHDVANALETIVMTHYLLAMGEHSEQTRQWLQMMEAGVQRASALNKELGEYIHQNS